MKSKDLVKFKKSQWLKLGGKLATRIVEDADKGISQDGDGDKFPAYSTDYSLKKRIGKATPKGVSASKQTNPPNLRLTGTMLNSLKVQKATTESVEINYRDGEKVIGHSRKRGNKPKRNIYGLNNKNLQFVQDFINDNINDNIKKFNKKDIIIDVKI
jgi:hypothetical protein